MITLRTTLRQLSQLQHCTTIKSFTNGKTPPSVFSRHLCSNNCDLQSLFCTPQIHTLLKLITDSSPSAVHEPPFRRSKVKSVKVLSKSELDLIQGYASAFTKQRLQMPPVLNQRTEKPISDTIICSDSDLRGLLPANQKMVFVDISLNKTRRSRLIVIREPNGDLRHASDSERNRINQVYFPTPGRKFCIPRMFSGQYLQDMLQRGKFAYILDRACVQFEPDDAEYQRICHTVYDHIDLLSWLPFTDGHSAETTTVNPLKSLRHSRHYGPLALYLIVQRNHTGALVYEILSCQHVHRLGNILRLVTLLQPNGSFAKSLTERELNFLSPKESNSSESVQFSAPLPSDVVEEILHCTQIFIDKENLTEQQRNVLQTCMDSCRASLQQGAAYATA